MCKQIEGNTPYKTGSDTGTLELSLGEIDDFEGHVFQVREDADMQALKESVRKIGVTEPICVRKKEDGRYESITGHRRRYAARLTGMAWIPARVLEVDDDTARLIMVETNLSQRSVILPSEKAKAYKIQLEAIKRQGIRADLTCAQVEHKLNQLTLKAREVIANQYGTSHAQISRYIRLTELIPDLLEMVDVGKLKFNPAVSLSYLSEKEQKQLYETMQLSKSTPSLKQANRLKEQSENGMLSSHEIELIMSGRDKPMEKIIISTDKLGGFLPHATPRELQDTLIMFTQAYEKMRKYTSLFPDEATPESVMRKLLAICEKEEDKRRRLHDACAAR